VTGCVDSENFAGSIEGVNIRSQVAGVIRYIAEQKQHHRKIDSGMGFELLLGKHGFMQLD
jgi:hypothetical protein